MENLEHVPKYPVQTLTKALDIIMYLKGSSSSEGTTITEISNALNMGKSGVHRLLDTLMAYGFVEKAGSASSSYRLGWGLYNAGSAVPKQHTLSSMNYVSVLGNLCGIFNETVNMGVLNNNEAVIIYKIEPEIKLRANMQVGEREPLYSTAVGKLFLSDFKEDELKKYFSTIDFEKFTPNTITDYNQMKKELEKIHEKGYAVDNEEYFEGMICFAMPILDFSGKVAAGISVSGPSRRMTKEKLAEIKKVLGETCKELSIFLGYSD